MYSSAIQQHSVAVRARAEQERRRRAQTDEATAPSDWRAWLETLYPAYVASGFSARHEELWRWVWSIERNQRVPPLVAVWPRGGGKSTSAELATVALGARDKRTYMLYVCETQEQADDHIGNISALLESATIARYYPRMGEKLLGKFGNSKGWRRNRLRTASGFTVDALGLDVAARGIKLEEHRPDGMIIDDIDGEDDSEATTAKKMQTLTRKLLPAGTEQTIHLAVQNLVHEHSIFAQLVDGRADFLSDRIVSGPHPALTDFAYDDATHMILRGEPTWDGQSRDACHKLITTIGIDAFRAECQHERIGTRGRFLPSMALWDACRAELPTLDGHTPVVLALDAGESSDTFASVLISAHPSVLGSVAARYAKAYVPDNAPLDYEQIEAEVRLLCKHYAVQSIVYDPMLLGQMVRRLERDRVALCVPFPQGSARLDADKQLLDLIETRRIAHDGNAQLTEHLDNANRKTDAEGRRLRIVKRKHALKIDLAVALSMGCARFLSQTPVRVERPAGARQTNRWSGV